MTGATNRKKGHNFEREIAKLFREAGYTNALTSRQASRLYDDCMIDIWGIPDNVQAKNVKANINPMAIFRQMKKVISEKLEPVEKRLHLPFVLIHKQNREIKVFVEMSMDDYFKWKSLEANSSNRR